MKISREDAYEEMAASFQCFQIQTLYETLKEHGVEPATGRSICERFARAFGVALDQFWIDSEAGKVFPVVGFTRRHQDHEPEVLHLTNGMFSFAEYAFGNNVWYFDEHDPDESPQGLGPVGESGEPA